jgi:hypothetical protein
MKELVVISPLNDWTCCECEGTGDLLVREGPGPLCLACAELDHLVFLGRGDAALTRRAKAGSKLWAVVIRFSRSRKRYERQGLLVEEHALKIAEAECLADADVRARRKARDAERRAGEDEDLARSMADEIQRLFPRRKRRRPSRGMRRFGEAAGSEGLRQRKRWKSAPWSSRSLPPSVTGTRDMMSC